MKPTVSRATDVESPMILGQIEQVVSSADCRSDEPLSDLSPSESANHSANRETGGRLTLVPDRESTEPLLTLEDRLLVALASRGNLRIGQLIVIATGASQPFYVEDRDLVELVERYVFEGERP